RLLRPALIDAPFKHHSALRLDVRIGRPPMRMKIGFVWAEPRMRTATQLLFSTRTSNVTSRMTPSAVMPLAGDRPSPRLQSLACHADGERRRHGHCSCNASTK